MRRTSSTAPGGPLRDIQCIQKQECKASLAVEHKALVTSLSRLRGGITDVVAAAAESADGQGISTYIFAGKLSRVIATASPWKVRWEGWRGGCAARDLSMRVSFRSTKRIFGAAQPLNPSDWVLSAGSFPFPSFSLSCILDDAPSSSYKPCSSMYCITGAGTRY